MHKWNAERSDELKPKILKYLGSILAKMDIEEKWPSNVIGLACPGDQSQDQEIRQYTALTSPEQLCCWLITNKLPASHNFELPVIKANELLKLDLTSIEEFINSTFNEQDEIFKLALRSEIEFYNKALLINLKRTLCAPDIVSKNSIYQQLAYICNYQDLDLPLDELQNNWSDFINNNSSIKNSLSLCHILSTVNQRVALSLIYANSLIPEKSEIKDLQLWERFLVQSFRFDLSEQGSLDPIIQKHERDLLSIGKNIDIEKISNHMLKVKNFLRQPLAISTTLPMIFIYIDRRNKKLFAHLKKIYANKANLVNIVLTEQKTKDLKPIAAIHKQLVPNSSFISFVINNDLLEPDYNVFDHYQDLSELLTTDPNNILLCYLPEELRNNKKVGKGHLKCLNDTVEHLKKNVSNNIIKLSNSVNKQIGNELSEQTQKHIAKTIEKNIQTAFR
jgi:hypothetical protein